MSILEFSKEEEVDVETKFLLPENFRYINSNGKILAIAVDVANWIVLNNEKELAFFKLLKERYTIQNAILFSDSSEEAATNVITQIIARDLTNDRVVSKQPDRFIQIYLTNACNMRCPHCYMFSGEKSTNELTLSEIERLIVKFAEYGGKKVVFTGGEVSLRQDLKRIISSAKSNNLEVEVLTNGINWNTYMFDWAKDLIDHVQISIDGYNEEENSKVRGDGNFNKALKTVEELVDRGISTRIAITPRYHSKLHEDIPKYCSFVKKLLKKYRGKAFGCSFSGEMMEGRNGGLSLSEQKYYKDCIGEIECQIYGTSKYQSFIETFKQHIIADNCAFGQLSVASNGNVFLCPKITNLNPIGNIRTCNLDDLFKLSFEASNQSNINNLYPCCECELKYICGGECRIEHFSYMKQGQLPTKDCKSERECNLEYKKQIYDLMIKTNEHIYQ